MFSPWRGGKYLVRVGLGPLVDNLEGISTRTGLPYLGRPNLLRATWWISWRGLLVMVRQNGFICYFVVYSFISFYRSIAVSWRVVSLRLILYKLVVFFSYLNWQIVAAVLGQRRFLPRVVSVSSAYYFKSYTGIVGDFSPRDIGHSSRLISPTNYARHMCWCNETIK